jgi:molybdenum cofactor cytidylyltransferase
MIVGALLLAGGSARRMGTNKLALPIDGVAILARSHAALVAAGLPVLLVTGAHDAALRGLLPDVPHVHAARHADGLSASIAAGVAAAPADWGALLVALGDMPFVRPATLGALAGALQRGAMAVAPVRDGRRGNPAGFARSLLPALASLSGDSGARQLLEALGPALTKVPVDDPGIFRDIDRPEDLAV